MSIQVRTTSRQDGASAARSQGPGLAVGLGSRGHRIPPGASFASVLGKEASRLPRATAEQALIDDSRAAPRGFDGGDVRGEGVTRDTEPRAAEADEADDPGALLDPLRRAMASGLEWQMAPPPQDAKAEPLAAAARVSLEHVVEQIVRKVAWSGNTRSGVMRIEIGEGSLSGANLLVQAEGADLRVMLDLPAGVDATSWRDRIERRLTKKGLRVTEFEVR